MQFCFRKFSILREEEDIYEQDLQTGLEQSEERLGSGFRNCEKPRERIISRKREKSAENGGAVSNSGGGYLSQAA